MSNRVLRICVPKKGKPYLRERCAVSDKTIDKIEVDARSFDKVMEKMQRLENEIIQLRSSNRSRKELPRPYPKNIPHFVGPGGKVHPITEKEWGSLEKVRFYGKERKKEKVESFIGPDGKRYNL